jgi:valyl-tRNA synthetase
MRSSDYDFQAATSRIYSFWMSDFCDVFLEQVRAIGDNYSVGFTGAMWRSPSYIPIAHTSKAKPSLKGPEARATAQTLLTVARGWLPLLAPFMPSLADEFWHRLPGYFSTEMQLCRLFTWC